MLDSTRLSLGFGILAILMAVTMAGNSAAISGRHALEGASAAQAPAGYLENLGETLFAEFTYAAN